jgi:uncharacterized protein
VLVQFFFDLRRAHVPVTLREYLTLLEALAKELHGYSLENFYYLARTALVKDERHFDRFDQVFGHQFKGMDLDLGAFDAEIPDEWLRKIAERYLSEEEKALIQSLGGWEQLMETLRERLREQNERHQGGSKWIGTGGTSPFGAWGYNPEGVRIGQDRSRHRRAVKVWDKREFRDFDDSVELGTRNMKVALRRLRNFTREGGDLVLDMDGTVRATADNAGWLDLKYDRERHNKVKVLLLLDVGGSMDDHIRDVERLFSACRTEFKHLEHWYFHNFVYEFLWRDNSRRYAERTATIDVLHTYGRDYKLIFVGDASMSPYEIVMPGGAVEHWNEEPGHVWMQRFLAQFPSAVWLNPVPRRGWSYTESIGMVGEMFEDRMFPLTLAGLDAAMRELSG